MKTGNHVTAVEASVSLRGVLILEANDQIRLASGIAQHLEVSTRILNAWHEAKQQQRKLFSVQGPDGSSIVIVALPNPETTVLVAMMREGRDPLFEFIGSVDFASDILCHFLTNPFTALTAVDRQGILRYISPVHEKFFGLEPGEATGRHASEVIENTRLHLVADSGKAESGALQEMNGVSRIVTRYPIQDSRGAVVGAIGQVMFKGPEQLQLLSSEISKLKSQVAYYKRELKDLRSRTYGLDNIVGESQAILRLKQQLIKVAPLDIPVLLTGESGTGKELAAHAIHRLSLRRDAGMVMVNAAALPPSLVESELFGYEAGAFTGAERKGKKGKIEQADRGSLFFDEVGDMPADVQVKLLRVLQDGFFERVGSNEPRRSDFRLISASNRNFEAMIADGTFRLDLFYRIGAVTIRLPALRERLEDIPLLADLALSKFAERHGQRAKILSADAISFLSERTWPGNVRQLTHAVERAAIFSEAEEIQPADFGFLTVDDGQQEHQGKNAFVDEMVHYPSTADTSQTNRVSKVVGQVEEQLIRQAMARFQGNKKRVAEELGLSRSYLYKRLAHMGMD